MDAFYECVRALPQRARGCTAHAALPLCNSFVRKNLPAEEASAEALAQARYPPALTHTISRCCVALCAVGWPASAYAALRSQGLHSLAERVAVHTDLCWRNFEEFAGHVFARPSALDAEAAAEVAALEAAAGAAFSSREEAELDSRAEVARCRLAAVRGPCTHLSCGAPHA